MQEMIIAYLQKTAAFLIPKSICRYLLQISVWETMSLYDSGLLGMV